MPVEIADAVQRANYDDDVRAIVVTGAGRAFCSGYDLQAYAEVQRDEELSLLIESTTTT